MMTNANYRVQRCGSHRSPDQAGILMLDIWRRMATAESWNQFPIDKQDQATDERIRFQTNRGRPLGSDSFINKVKNMVGRRLRPLSNGRPKKRKIHGLSMDFLVFVIVFSGGNMFTTCFIHNFLASIVCFFLALVLFLIPIVFDMVANKLSLKNSIRKKLTKSNIIGFEMPFVFGWLVFAIVNLVKSMACACSK